MLWAARASSSSIEHRRVTAVHAQQRRPPRSIDAWHHSNFHDLVDSLHRPDGFRGAGVAEADLVPRWTAIGVFVVEGLLMHPDLGPDRRAVVETSLAGRP